jgi:hypothetical protein
VRIRPVAQSSVQTLNLPLDLRVLERLAAENKLQRVWKVFFLSGSVNLPNLLPTH